MRDRLTITEFVTRLSGGVDLDALARQGLPNNDARALARLNRDGDRELTGPELVAAFRYVDDRDRNKRSESVSPFNPAVRTLWQALERSAPAQPARPGAPELFDGRTFDTRAAMAHFRGKLEGLSEPIVLEAALSAFELGFREGEIDDPYLWVIDYSIPHPEPRSWMLDLEKGELVGFVDPEGRIHTALPVGHGARSDLDHDNEVDGDGVWQTGYTNRYVPKHAREPQPFQSSVGLFTTGERQTHPMWKEHLLLTGHEPGINDNATRRELLIHPFKAVSEGRVSGGCYVVDEWAGKQIVQNHEHGTAMFVFGRDRNWLTTSRYLRHDPPVRARIDQYVARLDRASEAADQYVGRAAELPAEQWQDADVRHAVLHRDPSAFAAMPTHLRAAYPAEQVVVRTYPDLFSSRDERVLRELDPGTLAALPDLLDPLEGPARVELARMATTLAVSELPPIAQQTFVRWAARELGRGDAGFAAWRRLVVEARRFLSARDVARDEASPSTTLLRTLELAARMAERPESELAQEWRQEAARQNTAALSLWREQLASLERGQLPATPDIPASELRFPAAPSARAVAGEDLARLRQGLPAAVRTHLFELVDARLDQPEPAARIMLFGVRSAGTGLSTLEQQRLLNYVAACEDGGGWDEWQRAEQADLDAAEVDFGGGWGPSDPLRELNRAVWEYERRQLPGEVDSRMPFAARARLLRSILRGG